MGGWAQAKRGDVPWAAILTSLPVWAIVASHVGENWAFYTMLSELPHYIQTVLGFDIASVLPSFLSGRDKDMERVASQDGLVSALPFVVRTVVTFAAASTGDLLRSRFAVPTRTVRRWSDTTGALAPLAPAVMGRW